jgi:flagellar biosynthetic protein FliP
MQTIGALALVLALIFALRAVLRWQAGGGISAAGAVPRLLSVCAVGPRQRVCVIEAEGSRLLVGVTEHNVSLLQVLPEAAASAGQSEETRVAAPARRPRFGTWWLAAALALAALASAPPAGAEAVAETASVASPVAGSTAGSGAPRVTLSFEGPGSPAGLSPAFQMLGLLTLVAVAPSLLLLATCFTRIIVVLAFLRQAIGLQHMPPNQVLIGLALFLTVAVMAPVAEKIRSEAYEPFVAKQIEANVAGERALAPIRTFLLQSTREADLALFLRISKQEAPADLATTPLTALLPAFVISELRTAFEIGFMIFLPFLVVDLVVSSLLISMGMIVLPPIVVSLPFKLMLFVLVDGWNLVLGSLALGLA